MSAGYPIGLVEKRSQRMPDGTELGVVEGGKWRKERINSAGKRRRPSGNTRAGYPDPSITFSSVSAFFTH